MFDQSKDMQNKTIVYYKYNLNTFSAKLWLLFNPALYSSFFSDFLGDFLSWSNQKLQQSSGKQAGSKVFSRFTVGSGVVTEKRLQDLQRTRSSQGFWNQNRYQNSLHSRDLYHACGCLVFAVCHPGWLPQKHLIGAISNVRHADGEPA